MHPPGFFGAGRMSRDLFCWIVPLSIVFQGSHNKLTFKWVFPKLTPRMVAERFWHVPWFDGYLVVSRGPFRLCSLMGRLFSFSSATFVTARASHPCTLPPSPKPGNNIIVNPMRARVGEDFGALFGAMRYMIVHRISSIIAFS